MTRIAVCLLFAALAGCKDQRSEPAPPARYEAVKAPAASASRWCDNSFVGAAPRLTLPPLAAPAAGRGQASLPAGKRVWLNLWATWCQPCLREMPLLLKWQTDLRKDGVEVEVLLLSLDEDGPVLEKFLAEHKEFASAKIGRAASQRDYEQWVSSYVKDPGTPIPLHLLASADGNLRCVRGGSLREGDYPAAKAALR
jgi:thiol-disulfide isomerase/thioredoxin